MKRPIRGNQYVKNYQFDFNFGGTWGTCSVTMTSVIGHLAGLEFERPFRGWASCPPGALFEAPVLESVDPVRVTRFLDGICRWPAVLIHDRRRKELRKTSKSKPGVQKLCLSGPIVIEKVNILELRFGNRPGRETLVLRSSEQNSVTPKGRMLNKLYFSSYLYSLIKSRTAGCSRTRRN